MKINNLQTKTIKDNSLSIEIIKNVIFNHKVAFNGCEPFCKNLKDIINSDYIMNKIFENPEYILIIIYKLNIRYFFDLYILYILYMIAILHKKYINSSLLNLSIIVLNTQYKSLYNGVFKKINNQIKFVGFYNKNLEYSDEFAEKFFHTNNEALNDCILYDFNNILKKMYNSN